MCAFTLRSAPHAAQSRLRCRASSRFDVFASSRMNRLVTASPRQRDGMLFQKEFPLVLEAVSIRARCSSARLCGRAQPGTSFGCEARARETRSPRRVLINMKEVPSTDDSARHETCPRRMASCREVALRRFTVCNVPPWPCPRSFGGQLGPAPLDGCCRGEPRIPCVGQGCASVVREQMRRGEQKAGTKAFGGMQRPRLGARPRSEQRARG
jgi:hypothetical protein